MRVIPIVFASLLCSCGGSNNSEAISPPDDYVPQLENESAGQDKAERLERIKAGAARVATIRHVEQPTGSKPARWITNMFMSGCPEASDWYEMQDAVQRGDMSVDLPTRCFQIQPGTVIVTPPAGEREAVVRNGSTFEKGVLEDGREFWTDEMDRMSLTPL